MAVTKPDVRVPWADTGAKTDPGVAKNTLGWIAEIPTHQNFNWLLNKHGAFCAHANENGIPQWDSATDYPVGALVRGSDGNLYHSLQTPNTNQNPVSVPAFWQIGPGAGIGGGGPVAFGFAWSTDTTATDPGAGNLKADNGTYASITNVYIDQLSGIGIDMQNVISKLDVGDTIYIQEEDDSRRYILLEVSAAPTDSTGWFTIPVNFLDEGSDPLRDTNRTSANFIFSGSAFTGGLTTQDALIITEEQPSGTSAGGSVAATNNLRALNTVKQNTIAGASLAANQITLPAGTYYVDFEGPCHSASLTQTVHKTRLRQVSGVATTLVVGGSRQSCAGSGFDTQTTSRGRGRFVLSGTETLELQHYTSTTRGGSGLGLAVTSGEVEVYSSIAIFKVG